MVLRLRLLHPEEMDTQARDSIMDAIRQEKDGAKVNKGNEVSTLNKKFTKAFIEGLVVAFFFDCYGPVTLASKHWIENGTPTAVAEILLQNQNVLIIFASQLMHARRPISSLATGTRAAPASTKSTKSATPW